MDYLDQFSFFVEYVQGGVYGRQWKATPVGDKTIFARGRTHEEAIDNADRMKRLRARRRNSEKDKV